MSRSHLAAGFLVLAIALIAPACSLQSNAGGTDRPESMATSEWMHRVGQICGWARPQARRLMRSARRVRTFEDATEWVDEMTVLSARMNAVFRRLPPPRDRASERNRILRLTRTEDQLGEDLKRSLREGRGRAFFHLAIRMETIDRRIGLILGDLGIDGCGPGPREKPLQRHNLSA